MLMINLFTLVFVALLVMVKLARKRHRRTLRRIDDRQGAVTPDLSGVQTNGN
jgi:hypothetical protein